MKGIILHGGHGTRLRPLTHTGPKQLLKIANKPMSQYALEDLKNAGITEIAIIIGDVYPEKVKNYYGDGKSWGINITYVYQDEPKGIAHAISLCKEFIGNNKFVVYLGDNIFRSGLKKYVDTFTSSTDSALILLAEVTNPSQFGVAKIKNQKLIQIIEKPKTHISNFAVIGVYFLTPSIFEIIEKLKPSWRNEFEITEALQSLMNNGFTVSFDYVSGWWKDTGTPEDILHANQLILDTFDKNNSKILTNFLKNSQPKIIEPVIIGENCNIDDSVTIGPYVSIGNNVTLRNCKLSNSIIMDDCSIQLSRSISDSIIADGTKIQNANEEKYTFLLGERSNLKL